VNEREDETLGYAALLAESRSRQDRDATRQLETIGPPPWDSQSKYGVLTRQALAYEQGAPSILGIVGAVLIAPRYTLFDSWDWLAGLYTSQQRFLGDDMAGPFVTVNLPALGTNFAIPIFIFQGKDDNVTPAQLARALAGRLIYFVVEHVCHRGAEDAMTATFG
jgi:pimeloyl-ACP methyl ester carboxylesterase